MCEKCDIAQSRYFAELYGGGHLKPRLDAIRGLVNTHEDHPKAPPLLTLLETYGIDRITISQMLV